MEHIKYKIIEPDDSKNIERIAAWYLSEWNIPIDTTVEKIKILSAHDFEFQVLLTLDNIPIATGGVYTHVGLLEREPRLKMYKNWLALVYTTPENRGKGLGAGLCTYIQNHAAALGLRNMYLFTHTAESLYRRLGWVQLERIVAGDKDIVVMRKAL